MFATIYSVTPAMVSWYVFSVLTRKELCFMAPYQQDCKTMIKYQIYLMPKDIHRLYRTYTHLAMPNRNLSNNLGHHEADKQSRKIVLTWQK